jgi:hypothetical protein
MPGGGIYTEVTGTNLNDYGDNGNFETAYSGSSWGTNFNTTVVGATTVTRSSTQAYLNTYSCKVEKTTYLHNDRELINKFCHWTATANKKYRITAWLYTPSANVASQYNDAIFNFDSVVAGDYFRVTKSVLECTNNWVQIEIRLQQTSISTERYLSIRLENTVAFTYNLGGIVYIDNVKVVEIDENITNYDLTAVIVNTNGPDVATGSVTLSAFPIGTTYEYSKNGGLNWQLSNVFSSLAAGSYDFAFREFAGNPLVNLIKVFTVGIKNPTWNLYISGTNEIISNDGTITLSTSNSSGTPYTYQIQGPGTITSAPDYQDTTQGTGSFTALADGTYQCNVVDTYGNRKYGSITIQPGATCLLYFDQSQVDITDASDEGVADGAIQVVANDAVFGGTVWYKIGSDFIYPGGDNTTGLFSNLVAGTYTINARTSTSCRSVKIVTVKNTSAYGVRWRLDFNQINRDSFYDQYGFNPSFGVNNQFRLDIEEREYVSSVVEIKGQESPVVHSWRGEGEENPFENVIIPSQIEVNLISKTNLQFVDMFTSDERKFRAKFYIYNPITAARDLLFVGYGVPMTYSEPYQHSTNYPVSFVFTDGLGDLGSFEFRDESGGILGGRISCLAALSVILQKTGLKLNIHDKVNMYSTGMSTLESSGALIQRFFDTQVYKVTDEEYEDCATVLNNILKGCRVFQAGGEWHVELVSDKCNTTILQQIYTYKGVYSTFNVENNRYYIRRSSAPAPKLMTIDVPTLNIAQTYGSVKVTYNLAVEEENNLLSHGKFLDVDSNNSQFEGFTVTFDTLLGLETISSPGRELDDTCLSIRFDPYNPAGVVNIIADPVRFYAKANTDHRLKISFDVNTVPIIKETYIFVDFRFRYTDTENGTYYLQNYINSTTGLNAFTNVSSDLLPGGYIRVYIDDHRQWKTLTFETLFTPSIDLDGNLQLEFRVDGNSIVDADDLAELRAINADALPDFDNRRRRRINTDFVAFYEYEYAEGIADSDPDVIRPTIYTNHSWIRKKTLSVSTAYDLWLQQILFDNVKVEYYPNNANPETELVYPLVINTNTAPILEVETRHGDIYYSTEFILDDELDPNYARLMRGHWTTIDGSPTFGGWARRGVNENKFYHELLAKMVHSQFSLARWKLSGAFDSRERLVDFTKTFHELRTGRIYLPMALSVDYRQSICNFEIRESLKVDPVDDTGTPDIPGGNPGDNPDNNFVQHSEEHSNEHA